MPAACSLDHLPPLPEAATNMLTKAHVEVRTAAALADLLERLHCCKESMDGEEALEWYGEFYSGALQEAIKLLAEAGTCKIERLLRSASPRVPEAA